MQIGMRAMQNPDEVVQLRLITLYFSGYVTLAYPMGSYGIVAQRNIAAWHH